MKCTCTHFEIIGLVNDATLIGPEAVQGEDQILEGHENALATIRWRKTRSEASRNSRELSTNPAYIKELHGISSWSA